MYVSDSAHSAPLLPVGSSPVQTDSSRHNGNTVHAVDKNTLSCKGTLITNVDREPNTTGQSCSQKSLFSYFVKALSASQHRVYLAVKSSLDVLVEKGDKLIKPCLSAIDKVTAPIDRVVLNIAEPADKLLLFVGDNLACPMIQKAERKVYNAVNDAIFTAHLMVHHPALSSIYLTNLGVLLLSQSVTGQFLSIDTEATQVKYSTTFEKHSYGPSNIVTQINKGRDVLNNGDYKDNLDIGDYKGNSLCQYYRKVDVRIETDLGESQTEQVYISKNSLSIIGDQEFDVGNSLSTSQRLDIGLFAANKLYDAARKIYDKFFDDSDISGFLVAGDENCEFHDSNGAIYSQKIDTSDTTNEYISTFFVTRDVKKEEDEEDIAYFVPKRCNMPFEPSEAQIYVNDLPTAKFQIPQITTHSRSNHDNFHGLKNGLRSAAVLSKSRLFDAFTNYFESPIQDINQKCSDYLASLKTTSSPPETPAPTTLSNFTSIADLTTAEFDREFGTNSSEQYTEPSPSPLLTQNMTIETTPETIRKIWSNVTAIVGCAFLGLGAVSAVIYYLHRRQKQEVEDEENISATKDVDDSPEIMQNSMQNNEYAEVSDFLLSCQDEENISAANDGGGSPEIMQNKEHAELELSDFLSSLHDAHLNNRWNSTEDKEDLETETVI